MLPEIFKLPPELLCHIFTINADLQVESNTWGQHYRNSEGSPLNITRFTSQVCRHWREIILDSPVIWGNVIELQVLRQKRSLWRNEVMKRTGMATICIRGDVQDDKISTTFFFFLMKNHWERIRRLDISIVDLPSINPCFWRALTFPAPNLEVFRVSIPWLTHLPREYLIAEKSNVFFSGNAPLIREFHFPELRFSFCSAWIPQLCVITVSYPLSITDVYSLLPKMPLLESLTILQTTINSQDSWKSAACKIFLPVLKRIYLKHEFRSCLSILERIIPSPQCTLCLMITDSHLKEVTRAEADSMQAVLTQYARGHLNFNIKQLKLNFSCFHLSISAPSSIKISPIFRIDVRSAFIVPRKIVACFFGSLSSYDFSSVTIFEFIVDAFIISSFPSEVVPFLFSLPYVEILNVNQTSLQLLLDLPKEQQHVFPLLHTLVLDSAGSWEPFHGLLSMLEIRRSNKVPIKVLDLTKYEVDDLNVLKQVTELTVRWPRRKHIGELEDTW